MEKIRIKFLKNNETIFLLFNYLIVFFFHSHSEINYSNEYLQMLIKFIIEENK